MLCCTDYSLPDIIMSYLKMDPRINVEDYFFKNALYQIIYDTCTGREYYVQLVDENLYYVSVNYLNAMTNIFVTSKNFVAERPEMVAQQMRDIIYGCTPTSLTIYPTASEPNIISAELPMGQGVYPWPRRVFAPYVDITAWPTYQVADEGMVTGARYYNLGFIVSQSATDCTPTWGTYYRYDNIPAADQIPKLREMGGDVCVSFGGAANVPLQVCAADASTLKDLYLEVINAYDFRRIDLDIESPWIRNDEANIRNAQAIKMVQDAMNQANKPIEIWLTLPVATNGLQGDGGAIVGQMRDAGVNITGVNGMTMDYGPPIEDMGQAAIDAITALNTQLGGNAYDQIGATPMIGKNDQQGETFTLNNARTLLNFCEMNNVRQLSMWSVNRDSSSGSGVPQQMNEFTTTFQPYTMNLQGQQSENPSCFDYYNNNRLRKTKFR